jgi:hypothetical protein
MTKRTIVVSDLRTKRRAETGRHAWVRIAARPVPASKADEAKTGWWGRLRNISSVGLAVRLSRPFEPRTLLIIELTDKVKRKTCYLPVKVVHATAEGTRLWLIGCKFVRPLGEEELRALLED